MASQSIGGGFQSDLPTPSASTYIRQGIQTPTDNSAAYLLQGAEPIATAVKQGYGAGIGEGIVQNTFEQFLNAPGIASPQADATSVGLNGQVNQFANGQQIGSGAIDPNLVGQARDQALQSATDSFNKAHAPVQRAYQQGLITDQDLRLKLALNLKQASDQYPAFKQELIEQAKTMLSDGVAYYHYTSILSGLEAQRLAAQKQLASQQAAAQQAMNHYITKISDTTGVPPDVVGG